MPAVILRRLEKVREWGAAGWGQPYVLDQQRRDRREPCLLPYRCEEWWRSPEGLWLPTIRGGAYTGAQYPRHVWGYQAITSPNQGTLDLDSAYTYNSAGDAIGGRFTHTLAKTLAKVKFPILSFTGTAANVNDMEIEVRNDNNGPGSTLHDSQTHNPSSTTGWRTQTGFTFAMSASTPYWVIVGDADGNGTDFARLVRALVVQSGILEISLAAQAAGFQTTGGWASGVSALTGAAAGIVLVFSDGTALGSPYSNLATSTSSTNQRGYHFSTGITAGVRLHGVTLGTGESSANVSGLNAWPAGLGPSGSPPAGHAATVPILAGNSVTSNLRSGYLYAEPLRLEAATPYRIVFTYSASATTPRYLDIGTGADDELRSLMQGGGAVSWAEANGTTNWSNDNASRFPAAALILDDLVGPRVPLRTRPRLTR